MSSNGRGSLRPAGRTPPYLLIGLFVALCIVGFNYWNTASRNNELIDQMNTFKEQIKALNKMKIEAEKRSEEAVADKRICVQNSMQSDGKLKISIERSKERVTECERAKKSCEEDKTGISDRLQKVEEQLQVAVEKSKHDECDQNACMSHIGNIVNILSNTISKDQVRQALIQSGFNVKNLTLLLEGGSSVIDRGTLNQVPADSADSNKPENEINPDRPNQVNPQSPNDNNDAQLQNPDPIKSDVEGSIQIPSKSPSEEQMFNLPRKPSSKSWISKKFGEEPDQEKRKEVNQQPGVNQQQSGVNQQQAGVNQQQEGVNQQPSIDQQQEIKQPGVNQQPDIDQQRGKDQGVNRPEYNKIEFNPNSPVVESQSIPKDQIDQNSLIFKPKVNALGTGNIESRLNISASQSASEKNLIPEKSVQIEDSLQAGSDNKLRSLIHPTRPLSEYGHSDQLAKVQRNDDAFESKPIQEKQQRASEHIKSIQFSNDKQSDNNIPNNNNNINNQINLLGKDIKEDLKDHELNAIMEQNQKNKADSSQKDVQNFQMKAPGHFEDLTSNIKEKEKAYDLDDDYQMDDKKIDTNNDLKYKKSQDDGIDKMQENLDNEDNNRQ